MSRVEDPKGPAAPSAGQAVDESARNGFFDRWCRAIFEGASEAVYVCDPDGCVVEANPVGRDCVRHARSDMMEKKTLENQVSGNGRFGHGPAQTSFFHLVHPKDRTRVRRGFREMGRRGGGRTVEARMAGPNGRWFPARLSGVAIQSPDGTFQGAAWTCRDIRGEKRAVRKLLRLSTVDTLTGLLNRIAFTSQLVKVISAARNSGSQVALLSFDIDGFKLVNDTFGPKVGDEGIREVARRLRQAFPPPASVGRMGGDEFAVLLPSVLEEGEAAAGALDLARALKGPMVVDGREFVLTVSSGVSLFPRDGNEGEELLKHAHTAMYRAKQGGKNQFYMYAPGMTREADERLALEQALRRAIEREEFEIHYQPRIETASGKIVGLEALVRWRHPTAGLLLPGTFIPIAEETGLIVPLGDWVLRTASQQAREWQKAGLSPIKMAVNLSFRQFVRDDLADEVSGILSKTGLAPEWLELEITEGAIAQDIQEAIRTLTVLKRLGVRISVDDFGTGYSSLSHLKHFPVDILKVDRSFIRELAKDASDAAIVRTIISLAHDLRLTVVAEGVETSAQREFLLRHACDEIQGFWFSRPVPAEKAAEMLRETASDPSGR